MPQTLAPAKLNLYLHITGRRENGYHELDSLVAFCSVGDVVSLEETGSFNLILEGPFSLPLKQEPIETNLAVKAARLLAEKTGNRLGFTIRLVKNLPVASGIGGGSGDAAAVLRLLAARWSLPSDAPVLYEVARSLGQDIACCIQSKTCFFRGIGDITDPGPRLPRTYAVLVNPNKALATPAVYKARQGHFAAPHPWKGEYQTAAELAAALRATHNGLTEAACSLVPEVGQVLLAIETTEDCLLARMSGSGATCFGLYTDESKARAAADLLFSMHPEWWISVSVLPHSNP